MMYCPIPSERCVKYKFFFKICFIPRARAIGSPALYYTFISAVSIRAKVITITNSKYVNDYSKSGQSYH